MTDTARPDRTSLSRDRRGLAAPTRRSIHFCVLDHSFIGIRHLIAQSFEPKRQIDMIRSFKRALEPCDSPKNSGSLVVERIVELGSTVQQIVRPRRQFSDNRSVIVLGCVRPRIYHGFHLKSPGSTRPVFRSELGHVGAQRKSPPTRLARTAAFLMEVYAVFPESRLQTRLGESFLCRKILITLNFKFPLGSPRWTDRPFRVNMPP